MRKARTKALLQAQIEQAIKVTRSNRAAAEYLRVGYNLYKRYAKLYKDPATGESLFDIHKNQQGKGITKSGYADKNRHKLDDILTGKHPGYSREKLTQRLFVNKYKEERCESCGFCTKRPTDLKTPLLLHHINGDKRDHVLTNLQILCYNCYFIQVGDLRQDSRLLKTDIVERPETPVMGSQEILDAGVDPTSLDVLTEEEKLQLLKSLENL